MLFNLLLLLEFVVIVHSISQDIRSLELIQMINFKYQCNSPCGLLSTIVPVLSLRDCQIACLANTQCRTASFSQFINQCELFATIPGHYGTLLEEVNVITMMAIDDRQQSTQSNLNWLINGNAETGPCELGSGIIHPTGWNYNGTITQMHYNTNYGDFWNTDPGPSDRGNCYFYGQNSAMPSMWQTVNLTYSVNPSLIDNQTVSFNFSAWLGGYSNQDDYTQASLTFTDQANQQVGNITTIGPVLAADRGGITSSVFRQTNGLVPIGARAFTVLITMVRIGGATNDGLIDNISVVFY